jgi:nucleotide-binding universal stress UspA family protein
MEQEAVRRLEQWIKSELPQVSAATAVVVQGQPGEEICIEAGRRGVSLIVIATHGHTGLRHYLLGSVAEEVVRRAPCSVLVIR